MPLELKGATSGGITLTAESVAGTNTITLPAATGTAVVNGSNSAIVSASSKASTSGTSIDFTGIPSWVKRITVMFNGVSTNGTSSLLIQLGTSGGIVSSGYASVGVQLDPTPERSASTAGFIVFPETFQLASDAFYGHADFCLLGSNTWTGNGIFRNTTSSLAVFGGASGNLGGALTQIRVTTTGGVNTFDAGTINIMYE